MHPALVPLPGLELVCWIFTYKNRAHVFMAALASSIGGLVLPSETILKPSFIDCGMTGVKLVRPDEEVTRDMCLSSWFYGVCV